MKGKARIWTYGIFMWRAGRDFPLYCFMAMEKAVHILNGKCFSDGGNIAMVFAIKHPDRVERLILNGANLNMGGVKRTIQIPIEVGYKMAKRFISLPIKMRKNSIGQYSNSCLKHKVSPK